MVPVSAQSLAGNRQRIWPASRLATSIWICLNSRYFAYCTIRSKEI